MKNKLNKFTVSCSDWEVEVDSECFESAAISGLIMAIKNFGSNLLISTTIMVSKSKVSNQKIIKDCEFFSTEKIFRQIGLENLSQGLLIIKGARLERELSVV